MSKIFNWDGRKGTLIDSVSKTKATAYHNPSFKKIDKGLAVDFVETAAQAIYWDSDKGDIGTNDFSLVIQFKLKGSSTSKWIFRKGGGGQVGYDIYYNSSGVVYVDLQDSNGRFAIPITGINYFDGKEHMLIFTADRDGNAVIRVDGQIVRSIAMSAVNGDLSNNTNLTIGASGKTGTDPSNSYVSRMIVHDELLTIQEINNYFEEFQHSFGITEQKRNFITPKPTDLSKEVDSKVGDETVTNGGFDSDTSWSKGTGWTISGGKANWSSGSSDRIYQIISLVSGQRYKFSFTISDSTSAIFNIILGSLSISSGYKTYGNGTYSEEFTFDGSGNQINIYSQYGSSNLSIDNVSIQPLTGLVAAYNMIPSNGKLIDISGNGNDGTISGAISTKDGMAFNGVDDIISSPYNTDLDFDLSSQSITVMARMKTTDSQADIIYKRKTSSDYNGFEFGIIGNELTGYISDGLTNSGFLTSNTTINDGKWHSCLIVYANTFMKFYVDGILNNTETYSAINDLSFDAPLQIASGKGLGIYKGEIQDVKIYNREFTPTEAQAYHNSFQEVTLRNSFSDDGADGIVKLPNDFTAGTGTYKINEFVMTEGELIKDISKNGDFSDGTTNWLAAGNHTQSIVNEELKVVASGAGGGSSNATTLSRTNYLETINTGHKYKWRFQARAESGTPTLRVRAPIEATNKVKDITLSTTMTYYEIEATDSGVENAYFSLLSAGTFYVDNISLIELAPLQSFDTGTKYLECDTAGTITTQSNQAYGAWEWDVYKGYAGNSPQVHFLNNNKLNYPSNSGYFWFINSLESVQLYEGGNNLLASASAYIDNYTWYRFKIARLASEGVFKDIETLQTSDMVNGNYTTFTSNGRYGFDAISDGSTIQDCGTADEIPITNGIKYLVELNIKKNSGSFPVVRLRGSLIAGTIISNNETLKEGRNSFILTATTSTTGVLSFKASSATDYSISGLTIRRIYDKDTFAVFIKGGTFGNDYTLVSTSGGSGDNPVQNSTYTTSNYCVLDLDQNDKITNLKFKSEVEQ